MYYIPKIYIYIFYILSIFSLLYSLYLAKDDIGDLDLNIKKLVFTFALLFLFYILLVFIYGDSFKGISDEWEELYNAKLIYQNKMDEFWLYHRHGVFYPFIVSLFFHFANLNPEIGSYISYIFGFMTLITLYFIVYILSQNHKLSLISAISYMFSSFFYKNTLLYKGTPIITAFFISFIFLFILLSIKYKKNIYSIIALSASAIACNLRQELIIYFMPSVFLFFRNGNKKNKIDFFLFSLTAPAIFLFLNNLKPSFSLWGFSPSSDIGYLNYLIKRILDFINLFFFKEYNFLYLFFIFSLIFTFKKIEEKKYVFLSIIFFIFNAFVYVVFKSTRLDLEFRYMSFVSPLFFAFIFISILYLKGFLKSISFILVFLILFKNLYFLRLDNLEKDKDSWQDYGLVKETIKSLQTKGFFLNQYDFLVIQKETKYLWNFFDIYNVYSFQEYNLMPDNDFIYIKTPELESYTSFGDNYVPDYKKLENSIFKNNKSDKLFDIHNYKIWLIKREKKKLSCNNFGSNDKYLIYISKKEYYKAASFMDNLIDFDKNNPRLYIDRAVAEVLIGQNGKAKLDLERAINLDLDCVDAYFNLGNIYRYEGDYDKAFYYYGISKNKLEKDFSIYKDKRDKMLKKINEELNFLNKNKNAKIKDKRLP